MSLGRKKLIAAFLEKDNLKLLVYETGMIQASANRVFAGQITFDQETLRDAFVADAGKFNSQVKVAFAQKMALRDAAEVILFLPPDKTFTKTMAAQDSVDGFVQSLPYFREELIMASQEVGKKGSGKEKKVVTHVAFEKKLVEDLQRPFLESGKTIVALRSSVNDLVAGFPREGTYLLLCPFEKEVAFAVATDGAVNEASEFKTELFVSRFGEYVVNHNLGEIKTAYSVGVFPAELAEKLRHASGLNLASLAGTDIYDLTVTAFLQNTGKGVANLLGSFDLAALRGRMPNQKKLFLAGAAVVGFVLVLMLVQNLDRLRLSGGKKSEVVTPIATETAKPAPEPKPADFPVAVLNGTLVEGEAGRLAAKLKDLGFDVTETKNATSAGFVATRLRVVTGVPDKIVATLKSALEQTYESVVVEPLVEPSAGSGQAGAVKVEIIIGKKK